MKRILYLFYYIKKLDQAKFKKFVRFVKKNNQISSINLYADILSSSLKYNISILDYFYFRFYAKGKNERKDYAGTGYMYEYQLKMNPKSSRKILENKLLFLEKYSKFIKHKYISKADFIENELRAKNFIQDVSRLVIKSSDGQCGEGVEVVDMIDRDYDDFLNFLYNTENDLIEEFIIQHKDLMKLSSSGLNSIRVFTQISKQEKVEFLGARLRITINSHVDNLAAGNIAATIDIDTGVVIDAGVYSDITKTDEQKHPTSNVEIKGFKIPFWDETIEMVKEAALLYPQNKSIGWDVAITDEGPELLEGNHNWCKLLWQLPVRKGLKSKLEEYL